MNLYWEQYMGPGGHRADGQHSVYIILDEGNLAKLYQMPDDDELSPVNPQRARKYQEYGPGVTEGHGTGTAGNRRWQRRNRARRGGEDADA
jgi:hypothetical protein